MTNTNSRVEIALRALFAAHIWVEDEDLGLHMRRNVWLPGGPADVMRRIDQ